MKTYEVVLTKSYTVKIKAGTAEKAKRFAEFYTGNIEDISLSKDRKKSNFYIEEIECCGNEGVM